MPETTNVPAQNGKTYLVELLGIEPNKPHIRSKSALLKALWFSNVTNRAGVMQNSAIRFPKNDE
jgi:hypothetical protein